MLKAHPVVQQLVIFSIFRPTRLKDDAAVRIQSRLLSTQGEERGEEGRKGDKERELVPRGREQHMVRQEVTITGRALSH